MLTFLLDLANIQLEGGLFGLALGEKRNTFYSYLCNILKLSLFARILAFLFKQVLDYHYHQHLQKNHST